MRKSIARFVFPVLAAVLTAGTMATGQGPGGPGGPGGGPGGMGMGHGFGDHRPPFEKAMGDQGRWWNNPRMIDRLKITDDQRKAMDEILYQHREKLIDLQANLQRAELAMEPLMSADQPDRAAISAQIDKIVASRADLEKANSLFLLDIRLKLTPDQWKQLKDMRMMDRRGMDRRGAMDRRGPGGAQGRMWRQHSKGPGGAPPQGNPPDGNPPAGNPPADQAPSGGQQPPPQ